MIKNSLLSFGCSWQFSTLFPFVFLLVLGWFIYRWVKVFFPNKWLKRFLFVLLTFGSPVVYFIVNPIYAGDFDASSSVKEIPNELSKYNNNTLVVVTIPNCPFCYQSVYLCNQLKERNPKLNIVYIVTTTNPAGADVYKEIAVKGIQFKLAESLEDMAKLSDTSFPSFVLLKDGKAEKWSNNNIGPATLDYIENSAE